MTDLPALDTAYLPGPDHRRLAPGGLDHPPRILLLVFLVYAASGPVQYLLQLRRDKTLP